MNSLFPCAYQHNAILKQAAQSRTFEQEAISPWDLQLIRLAEKNTFRKKKFIAELIPIFQHYYSFISGAKENVEVHYESQLNAGDFAVARKVNRKRQGIYSIQVWEFL